MEHKDVIAILLATRYLFVPPRDTEAIQGPAYTALALLELARTHNTRLCPLSATKCTHVGVAAPCFAGAASQPVSCGMIQSWAQLLVIPLQMTGWLYRAGSEGAL